MTNPAKRRGTAFETAIVGYLADHGFPFARRLALRGGTDWGDISLGDHPIGGPVTIEAKDHQSISLAQFVDEAILESQNAGTPLGVAIIKRRGKGIHRAYVVTDLESWVIDRINRGD